MTADGFVTIARITRTQGHRGELGAELHTDFPRRFQDLARVFLARGGDSPREFRLHSHWFHKGGVVLGLEGIDSITDAEAWIGAEVQVPASERAAAEENQYFISDLVGCEVFDRDRAIGILQSIEQVGEELSLLHLQGGDNPDLIVPFAREYIRRIDTPSKRIELELPEGLLEL